MAALKMAIRDGSSRRELGIDFDISKNFAALFDFQAAIGYIAGDLARCRDTQRPGNVKIAVKPATDECSFYRRDSDKPAAARDFQGACAVQGRVNSPFNHKRITFGDIALQGDIAADGERLGILLVSPARVALFRALATFIEVWNFGGPDRLPLQEAQVEIQAFIVILCVCAHACATSIAPAPNSGRECSRVTGVFVDSQSLA